jgi:hypothetical protein
MNPSMAYKVFAILCLLIPPAQNCLCWGNPKVTVSESIMIRFIIFRLCVLNIKTWLFFAFKGELLVSKTQTLIPKHPSLVVTKP